MDKPSKVLIICRGCPGSGKSTLAKQLGSGGVVLSTDDFWMQDGEYKHDRAKLPEAHAWNQKRAVEAMQKGISPLVIDNTNIQAWEPKPYVEAALRMGYQVRFAEPNTPWAFDAEELTKRNTHNVPKDVIEQMLRDYHHNLTVDDVLKAEPPSATPPSSDLRQVISFHMNWYRKYRESVFGRH